MDKHLQAIVTVLSLVNPMVCGMIFSQLEGSQPKSRRMADASQAAFAVLVILILAALFGTQVLHLFGVSLDAFSVAGGAVLAWIGFSMLSGNSATTTQSTGAQIGKNEEPSLTPLILFAASPGTITGVITVAASQRDSRLPITALVAVTVAVVVLWGVLFLVSSSKKSGASGGFVRDTVTRFMGLIVVAMGVQFALTGFRAFMK